MSKQRQHFSGRFLEDDFPTLGFEDKGKDTSPSQNDQRQFGREGMAVPQDSNEACSLITPYSNKRSQFEGSELTC